MSENNVGKQGDQGYDPPEPQIAKVLIVSDDAQAYLLLKRLLNNSGFAALLSPAAMEPSSVAGFSPGLVVIDLSTNKRESSYQKMLLLRSCFADMPILGIFDQPVGVEAVARFQTDDFVFKPFELGELTVRMRLLLERFGNVTVKHDGYPLVERRGRDRRRRLNSICVNNSKPVFRIDSWSRQVFLRDQCCQLTPKEYALFCLLASCPGRVFPDEEIIPRLWPENRRAAGSDVEQFIHRLRKKLKEDPFQPHWVLTVKGFGYKFKAGVLGQYANG